MLAENILPQSKHPRTAWFFSVRGRLVLLVILALLPAAGLIVFIGWEQRQEAARDAENEALRTALVVAGQQQRYFDTARQTLLSLARVPEVVNPDLPAGNELFASVLKNSRTFVNIGLIAPNGDMLASGTPTTGRINLADEPWLQQALTGKEFVIGEYGIGRVSSRPSFRCALPVLNEDGQSKAVLYAALDLKWLGRFAAEAMLPFDATVLVMDEDGRLMGRYPSHLAAAGGTGSARGVVKVLRPVFPSGTVKSSAEDGTERLYAVVPAGSVGKQNQIFVAVGIPMRVAFAAVNERIARNLLALSGVLVLALAAAWVGGNLFIVRQLRGLVKTTRRLAAGQFGARTGQGETKGELGLLARAFDDMAATLESRDAALQQAMQSLRESEGRFRDVFGSSPDAVFVEDLEGRVLDVNPAACRLHGSDREQLIGRPVLDLVPQAKRAEVARDFSKLASGQWDYLESESLRADGAAVPVELRTRVFRYAGQPALLLHVRDLTERRRAQEALRRSEERFRSLIENSLDVTLVLDQEQRLRYISPSIGRVLGYSVEQCQNRSLFDFVYAEDAERLRAGLTGDISQPGQSARLEFRLRHQDGSWRNLEAIGKNLSDTTEVAGVVLNCRDVTERKRVEAAFLESNDRLGETLAELRAAQQQAIQQARLRALGQMASGIAHDFNNALATILGFSELLLMRAENRADEKKLQRYLDHIHTSAKDAANIVSRLREFYREREANEVFQPVDLHDVVRQAVSLTRPLWKEQAEASGRTIEVRLNLEPVPAVDGNGSELRQALTNLIFNAVDALPTGGTITLQTSVKAGHVILAVSDTGTGMTEEVRQRCLEPFFSTKGERGTGLGLAQVYGIIRRHDGFIDIQTKLGQGSTIQIHLPPLRRKSPSASAVNESVTPVGPALEILLVEDDPAVADVQAEFLRGDGHRVEVAVTGMAGLERFDGGRFNLVITDRAMPGMSGDEVAAEVKKRCPEMPVIMLTGFGDIMKAAGEHPAGVDVILSKPVAAADLRETIHRLTCRR